MDNRIKDLLAAKSLSPSAFADTVSVPRSTISHVLSGRNKPSLDLIQKILDAFPDIRTEWLVRGTGSMLTGTPDLFNQPVEPPDFPRQASSDHTKQSQDGGKQHDTPGERVEDPDSTAVRSEPEMRYGNRSAFGVRGKRVVHIVAIYSDDTFSIYNPSVESD